MDKIRIEFEKWALSQEARQYSPLDLHKTSTGAYSHSATAWAFRGYQAATKEAEKYREALETLNRDFAGLTDREVITIIEQALQKD